MKAVVVHGKGDFRYEDVPDPQAGEEEIVVKIGRLVSALPILKFITAMPISARRSMTMLLSSPAMSLS